MAHKHNTEKNSAKESQPLIRKSLTECVTRHAISLRDVSALLGHVETDTVARYSVQVVDGESDEANH